MYDITGQLSATNAKREGVVHRGFVVRNDMPCGHGKRNITPVVFRELLTFT